MRAAVLRPSVAWLAACALACALGGPIACGPPDSFDGLVGGSLDAGSEADAPAVELRPDPELAPPRPIAPLSQSWINGPRPRFEWQLASGATGARIELCRTRACDGEKKTLDVAGIATDYCVRASALDALAQGQHVRVLTGLVAGVAAESSDAALAEMAHAGAELVAAS